MVTVVEMPATATAMTRVSNLVTAAMTSALNAMHHFAPAMATVMDQFQVTGATAIVYVHSHLMTAAMMSVMNAVFCHFAQTPTPVTDIVVDKLQGAATATVIAKILVTAALMCAMNAMYIVRRPTPVSTTVMDKLQGAAGAIVFVSQTMTAAPIPAMYALSTARKGAGGGSASARGV